MVTPLPNFLGGLHSFVDPRRQALLGLAAGLVSGNNWNEGLGRGFQMAAQGKQADDAYRVAEDAKAKREQQLNYTIQMFQKAGRQDLVDMANAGFMSEAWDEFRSKPEPAKPIEVNGQLIDPNTYEVIGDYRTVEPPETPKPPSGYQYGSDGALTYIPGGPADPKNKRGGGMPSATLQKEMFETDESILAGQNVLGALDRALELNKEGQSRSGWGADIGATIGANVPDFFPGLGGNQQMDANTLELKNLVTAQALDQLKATFGAMPTEGERKILLEIQGSVDQPREVREAIFRRARAAAEKRLAFNRKKAEALRSGQYFDEGFTPMSDTTTGDPELDQLLSVYGY